MHMANITASLKIRVFCLLFLLCSAIYILIPTIIYFRLNDVELKEVRHSKDNFYRILPSWTIKNHIVPGLDLQGGVHIVLGVDTDKALNDKTARIVDYIKNSAREKKIQFLDIDSDFRVSFLKMDDMQQFSDFLNKNFHEIRIISTDGLIFQLDLEPDLKQNIQRDVVDQTANIIQARVDKMGIIEPNISKRGLDKIQIQLPGFDNTEEAKNLIGRTAQLEFQVCDDKTEFLTNLNDFPKDVHVINNTYKRPNDTFGRDIFLKFPNEKLEEVKTYLSNKVPEYTAIKYGNLDSGYIRTYTVNQKVFLTGNELIDAYVYNSNDSNPVVSITFNSVGAKIFDEITRLNTGNRIAIVLEDYVNSAPILQTRISDGRATITLGGNQTYSEILKSANQLAFVLKSGALPASVSFQEERSIGPSLGYDSIKKGKLAFYIGSVFVMFLMIFYYRLSGFFSVVAVLLNLLLMLAFLAWLGATITLPGIAGLLLTFGIAVDANIIINERIREELRKGRTPKIAISTGYKSAFTAVFDSHVTSFIAGIILWKFGTGPVQNFAMMLIIGTVLSIFTAIFITRIFFDIITKRNPLELSI